MHDHTQKYIWTCLGLMLLTAGICYTSFFFMAMRECNELAVGSGFASQAEFQDRYFFASRALKITEVDLFAPGTTDPSVVARTITRRMYAHVGLGILTAGVGSFLLVKTGK